jgi:hypothetical protein
MSQRDIAIVYVNENNETSCHIFKTDDVSEVFLENLTYVDKYKQDPLNNRVQEALEWIIDECEDSESIKHPGDLSAYNVYIVLHTYLRK